MLNKVASNPTGSNSAQTSAIQQLESNANNATNFGQPVAGVTTKLLAGGDPSYQGLLSDSYKTLQGNLTPYANGSMVGKNTALQGQLDTAANDVKNSVQSQFAAAGRSFSPSEAQAIARGTAQAQAPIIAAQYNQDVQNQLGANNALYNAGQTTGTGLNAMTTGNQLSGIQAAGAYPGILNSNATSLLQAGNYEQQLPYQGTGLAESQLLPIAGLGAQSSGTGTQTTTQNQSLGSTIMGGILGGTALLGSGGLNVLGPLGAMMI